MSSTPLPSDLLATDEHHTRAIRLIAIVGVVLVLPLVVVGALVLPWFAGVIVGLAIGGGLLWWLVATAERRVMSRLGADEIDEVDEPRLHNLVDGLAVAVGTRPPTIVVLETLDRNAGAVGWRGPGTIVVTHGLLDVVSRIELEGIVARELTRLRSGQQAPVTLAAGMIGWFAPALADRLAPSQSKLDDDVLLDAAAVRVTRYPPGLADGLRRCADAGPATRVTQGVSWMIRPDSDAVDSADPGSGADEVRVRVDALDER